MFLKTGFIVGNGESRRDFTLSRLYGKGTIYGCNAIYRDFKPDLLFVRDKRMIEEIKDYNGSKAAYSELTKEIVFSLGSTLKIPDNLSLSGAIALYSMCALLPEVEDIYLLGFDSVRYSKLVNNVYKDTKNYKKSDEESNYVMQRSIEQVLFVMSRFSSKKFYAVNTRACNEWESLGNFELLSYDDFSLKLDCMGLNF